MDELIKEFGQIPAERRKLLAQLAQFIQSRIEAGAPVNLNFICTHNSRRSHMAQIWAQAAAARYNIPGVHCYSGGTEATAFDLRAVQAVKEAGFLVTQTKGGANPVYEVRYSQRAAPVISYSKKYDDPFNPSSDFAAVMTCSHADENCPIVTGAAFRIALTYDDPKHFDGTPKESDKYRERVDEIGREILFSFSMVTVRGTNR
ncbi:MAG: protein-tyrosine-phosphatase [Bacteroidetes bacterium]|nr:protein-tyrosine-phosphatase [Bacteroidota bacterium]